jgi:hypothetical protein
MYVHLNSDFAQKICISSIKNATVTTHHLRISGTGSSQLAAGPPACCSSKAPAIQRCEINPAKNRTIAALLDATFLPITSTGNIPTPYITPRTIAYIHALIVDSITLHASTPFRERALLNENMLLDVLDLMSPEDFHEESFTVLNKHHVEIV